MPQHDRTQDVQEIESSSGFVDASFHTPSTRNTSVKTSERPSEDPCSLQELNELLGAVSNWRTFDVFRVAALCQGRPLQLVTLRVLEKLGISQRLELSLSRVRAFLEAVEEQYEKQPYHNNVHAADVVQALGSMVMSDVWTNVLTDMEILGVIIAAAVHDMGHPGLSNDFHKRTNSGFARRFKNADSYNETMHAELALCTLANIDYDFVAPLGDDFSGDFKILLQDLVLSTDMVHHRTVVDSFTARVESCGRDVKRWPAVARRDALRMLLHCADISNPARPWDKCQEWGRRIQEELFLQGDKERTLGLSVTPVCDRSVVDPAQNQAVFIDRIIMPCITALQPVAPEFVSEVRPLVEQSLARWRKMRDRLRKDEDDDYSNPMTVSYTNGCLSPACPRQQ